jgi:hypothetical protein
MDEINTSKRIIKNWVYSIVDFINDRMVDTGAKYETWINVIKIIDREDFVKKARNDSEMSLMNVNFSDLYYLELLDKYIEGIDIWDFEDISELNDSTYEDK